MKEQRQSAMEEFINVSGSASIEQLCSEFNVSVNTVRRDLAELSKLGRIKKVYGGVISNDVDSQHSAASPFLSYNERSKMNVSAKKSIARVAAGFIENNDIVFIDAGTTTINIVPYFKNTYNVTVVTCCIPIIAELSKFHNVQILIPPGKLLHNGLSIVGSQTEEYLANIEFDKAFMACTSITPDFDLTTSYLEESVIKGRVLAISRENILLADGSKFRKKSRVNYGKLNVFHQVISDQMPTESCAQYMQENGIEFISAK